MTHNAHSHYQVSEDNQTYGLAFPTFQPGPTVPSDAAFYSGLTSLQHLVHEDPSVSTFETELDINSDQARTEASEAHVLLGGGSSE